MIFYSINFRIKIDPCSYLLILTTAFLVSCSSSESELSTSHTNQTNQQAEYIYRKHNESLFTISLPGQKDLPKYSWTKTFQGKPTKITKEFFRCKGNVLNPCHIATIKGELRHLYDCGGAQKHGLPLRDSQEFIYPIILELLNYIQEKTNKTLVITSGHRCPEHNTYVDHSSENQYSKHTIGAEVSFYVQGFEQHPDVIVRYIQEFYNENPRYQKDKNYIEFLRYDKETNTHIQPWYNKEIFIKIFSKNEGRNFDNRHPYPYLSLQVRHDRDLNERVVYSNDKAYKNYHRR